MDNKFKDEIIKLYEDRFSELGYDIKTIGWKSTEDQVLRFKVLSEIGDLTNSSVCDVGCGFGDLVMYLKNKFMNTHYRGVDISPSLIQKAQELYPGEKFSCIDILKEEFNEQHDFFLLSGALSYKIDDNMKFANDMISKMFSLCRKGIALNFLSTYVNFQHPRNFHYQPEEMLSLGKKLTPWVALRHDYPLWEFTLYLYKNPTV